MQKPYNTEVELYDGFVRNTGIHYISGDSGTMPLTIKLLKHGKPITLADSDIVVLNFETQNKLRFARLAEIANPESGGLYYEVSDGDIAAEGEVSVGITVIQTAKKLSWHGFKFTVSGSRSEGQTEPPLGAIGNNGFFIPSISDEGDLVIITNDLIPPPISINDGGDLIYSFETEGE